MKVFPLIIWLWIWSIFNYHQLLASNEIPLLHVDSEIEDQFKLAVPQGTKSLFIIAIRFIGQIVTVPQANIAAAIRCDLFQHITLPSLVLAIKHAPIGSLVRVMIINESAIVEPTCYKLMRSIRTYLPTELIFAPRRNVFVVDPKIYSEFDFIFFSRLDTDDAFPPSILQTLQYQFFQSGLPIAVLSPLFVSLWYPTSTKSGKFPCGELQYSTISRNFQIMQTTAISLKQYTAVTGSHASTAIEWLRTAKALPYSYSHEQPQEAIHKVAHVFHVCKIAADCLLFLNSWVRGASGFVYTQTGLQNSYQTTKNPTQKLKFYNEQLVQKRHGFPDFCEFIEDFGINRTGLQQLQRSIFQFNAANSSALKAIQTMTQHSLLTRQRDARSQIVLKGG